MTMPTNQNQTTFNKQLSDWQRELTKYQTQESDIQSKLSNWSDYSTRYSEWYSQPKKWIWNPFPLYSQPGNVPVEPGVTGAKAKYYRIPGAKEAQAKAKSNITRLTDELLKNQLFQSLYSEIPVAIQSGAVSSSDDVLSKLPSSQVDLLTSDEMSSFRTTIDSMFQALAGRATSAEGTQQVISETTPELVAPNFAETRTGLHAVQTLTVQEILKALNVPKMPPQVMSDEEWQQYLETSNSQQPPSEDALDFVKMWQERNNQIEAYKSEIAKMPDYRWTDFLNELWQAPGLALGELAEVYFEHVTRPLSGMVYANLGKKLRILPGQVSGGDSLFPDIQKAYEEYRKTDSEWVAYGRAWNDWDNNMWLKMLMETPLDPMTYVGWGIATKMAKPIPYVGRFVGAAESGFAKVMDIPFDLIKAGVSRIPQTVTQRAIRIQNVTAQISAKYLSQTFKTPFRRISDYQWGAKSTKLIDDAIKFAQKHPNSDMDKAVFGRQLLMHGPLNKEELTTIAKSLGSKISEQEITKETVEFVNNVFEDMFTYGRLSAEEAATLVSKKLDITDIPENLVKVQALLTAKSTKIINVAQSLAKVKSMSEAVEILSKRNFNIAVRTMESQAALAREQAGAFSTLLTRVSAPLQSVWRNQIDRLIVRPFAEAYLAFAMYGPMNVVEDYIRSAFGRVTPGSIGRDEFDVIAIGLSVDPMFREAKGISETGGQIFKRLGGDEDWNNWILQIGGLAKDWGDKVYTGLVRLPGAYSMDIRRNFIARRYIQILREKGGDTLEKLLKAGPTGLPKLSDKKLAKYVQSLVGEAKLSGDYSTIMSVMSMLSRKKIVAREVREVLSMHPELSNSARDHLLTLFNDDELLTDAGTITKGISETLGIIQDDFIRGPERAGEGFRKLADELIELEVKSPEDMAQLLQSVQLMSQMYGATPRQVMAQATIRSRGLPLVDRISTINADMDRIATYIERSGADIQRVVDKIKAGLPAVSDNADYINSSTRLLDVLTTKRELLSSFRVQNMEWRRGFFAGKKSSKDIDWDSFYSLNDSMYNTMDLDVARLDGQITMLSSQIDSAQGIHINRVPVKVVGRPLAPNDIARLLNVRGDDISRGLLDCLCAQNSKVHFVEYVKAFVRGTDEGFTDESIGAVYDQVFSGLGIDPSKASWLTKQQMELDAVGKDFHNLLNSKMLPESEMVEIKRYVTETANAVRDIANPKRAYSTDVQKWLNTPTDRILKTPDEVYNIARKAGFSDKYIFGADDNLPMGIDELKQIVRSNTPRGRAVLPEFTNYQKLRQSAMDEAHKWYYKDFVDYTHANAFDAAMKTIYPYWCMPDHVTILTKSGWKHHSQLAIGEDVLVVNPETLTTHWEPVKEIAEFDYDGDLIVIPAKGKDIEFTPNHRWLVVNKQGYSSIKRGYELTDGYDMIPRALAHDFPTSSILSPRDAAILGWCCTDGYINRSENRKPRMVIYQSLHKYLIDIQQLTGTRGHYRVPTGYSNDNGLDFTVWVKQADSDRILDICPDWTNLPEIVSLLSKQAAKSMWDAMFKAEGCTSYDIPSWKQNPSKVSEAFQLLSVLLGKVVTVKGSRINILSNNKPYHAKECRRMTTKHYKGKIWCPVTPSGTWFANCNGSIIPTGNTYESQRWFWLPRSFLQHPGAFTTLERYKDNTDSGYIHVPSTSVEINPFRGTIFGSYVGRLSKRDFPEYYDSLGVFSAINDLLERYGFFPGAHISIPMSLFGGQTPQMGESLPAIWRTPLDLTNAAFPNFAPVKTITEHIFHDNFRDYMTVVEATTRGADGLAIWTKMQNKDTLTPEEQAIWDASKRESSLYSALFEQTGMMRLKSQEQLDVSKASAETIEQMTGYSPEQQDWLSKHGYRIWDMVGGLSPTEQMQLKELDVYRWQGLSRPLLPSQQQMVLNKLDQDWSSIEDYVTSLRDDKLALEQQFRAGQIGAVEYNDSLSAIYTKQREYIDIKQKENPALTLEGRKDYYKKYGVAMPVQHPMRELLNLYFSVELKQIKDENGQLVYDWDSFWQQREAIENAMPPHLKSEWDSYMSRNSTPMERVRQAITRDYFKPYNSLWDTIIARYTPQEQAVYKEFKYLQTTGRNIERQQEIRNITTTGNRKLVSAIESDVSDAREALRYANPYLDAWLVYWGRTTSFKTQQARDVYNRLLVDTGRSQ